MENQFKIMGQRARRGERVTRGKGWRLGGGRKTGSPARRFQCPDLPWLGSSVSWLARMSGVPHFASVPTVL
jgi:hypothetical protein